MNDVIRLPNLASIVEPLLGKPYAEANCWALARLLIREGFGLDLAAETEEAARAVVEIWGRNDAIDPLTLVQPWDLFITAEDLVFPWAPEVRIPVSTHVGLVVDAEFFVHARRASTGVAKERMGKRQWRSSLFQVARLRRLL